MLGIMMGRTRSHTDSRKWIENIEDWGQANIHSCSTLAGQDKTTPGMGRIKCAMENYGLKPMSDDNDGGDDDDGHYLKW